MGATVPERGSWSFDRYRDRKLIVADKRQNSLNIGPNANDTTARADDSQKSFEHNHELGTPIRKDFPKSIQKVRHDLICATTTAIS